MKHIGHKYRIKATGEIVHCQDVDRLTYEVKVGPVDENGIVWEPKWMSEDEVEFIHEEPKQEKPRTDFPWKGSYWPVAQW